MASSLPYTQCTKWNPSNTLQ